MYSPLIDTLSSYGLAVLTGLVSGLVVKMYFAWKLQDKVRDYQSEIVKSHAKILELEANNYKLECKLKDTQPKYSKEMAMG